MREALRIIRERPRQVAGDAIALAVLLLVVFVLVYLVLGPAISETQALRGA